jgi:uncharacterized protein (TIGR02996 family)
MRTFEYRDDKSSKFWSIELQGRRFTVNFGRIGTTGQTQVKEFPDEAKARKEHDKLIAEKTGKGYVETTPRSAPVPLSLLEALEAALVAQPDDRASHMAYADYLSEQPDQASQARAEFIRVQLELEDTARPAAERKKLQAQEKKLQQKHQADWLGDIAQMLIDPPKHPRLPQNEWLNMTCNFTFACGWLDSLEVNRYTVAFMRSLARSPALRLLRRLVLFEQGWEERGSWEPGDDIPEEVDYYPQLYPLARSPWLGNVRILQIGESISLDDDGTGGGYNCRTSGQGALGLIKRMPRLEELYLLASEVDTEQLFSLATLNHLRVLHLFHGTRYPLTRLAKNPSLGRLTHLVCHPHCADGDALIRLPEIRAIARSTTLTSLTHLALRMTDAGDKGVKEIVDSGLLKRLKVLDLRHGCITDKGARMLAGCPDLKHLDLLALRNNCLTDAGVAALQATGVQVICDNQWQVTGDEYDDREYLFCGDIE